MKTVGIIGYGSFGKFLADRLKGYCEVLVFSRRHTLEQGIFTTLDKVAKSDYLILAIPLGAYEDYLVKLKPIIDTKTVLVDVCSVKIKPLEIIKKILPDQPVVATHPLFGPETASQSLAGHTLVICPEFSDKQHVTKIAKLAELAGLKVLLEPAEQHDKQMATIHALTFFIARALDQLNLKSYELDTPSYKRLLHIAELDKHHSEELFNTIEAGNPFSQEVRQQLIDTMNNLNAKIDKEINTH